MVLHSTAMHTFRVSASGHINAPASTIYRLIADYRDGHPRIVPPKHFRNIVVEDGGYGAGTRISFEMVVLGIARRARAVVEEPEPGRVLVERDLDARAMTTFVVDPARGEASTVTIATEMPHRPGIAAAMERFMAARVLPKIYRAELARLAEIATARPGGATSRP